MIFHPVSRQVSHSGTLHIAYANQFFPATFESREFLNEHTADRRQEFHRLRKAESSNIAHKQMCPVSRPDFFYEVDEDLIQSGVLQLDPRRGVKDYFVRHSQA